MEEFIYKFVETVSEGILQKIRENLDNIKSSKSGKEESEVFSRDDVCTRHIKQGYLKPSFYVGRSPRFTQSTIEEYISKFNEVKEV